MKHCDRIEVEEGRLSKTRVEEEVGGDNIDNALLVLQWIRVYVSSTRGQLGRRITDTVVWYSRDFVMPYDPQTVSFVPKPPVMSFPLSPSPEWKDVPV